MKEQEARNPSNLRHFFETVYVLAVMDLKLKYQNSFIGFLWSFIRPFLQFLVYFSIFGVLLKISKEQDYALALFYGVLVWAWFSEGTSLGMNSFIGKRSILTKVNVNKCVPPFAAFLTPTINYGINFCIFLFAFVLFGHTSWHFILTWGHLFLFVYSLLGIALLINTWNIILANLNVLFRDVQQIWELILTYGVFLTPVIYTLPIPKKYEVLYYSLNLLAYPLQNLKSIFFTSQPSRFADINITLGYLSAMVFWLLIALFIHYKLSKRVVDFL